IGEIALIYEHQWPLSALCFMESDGIRKRDLQGIIVRVTFDGFQTIFFIRDILIICGNAFIKLLLLGIRHLGRINIQTIEYDPTLYGVTLMIITKFLIKVRETNARHLVHIAYFAHGSHIAIGNESSMLFIVLLQPIIIVLYHRHDIPTSDLFIAE